MNLRGKSLNLKSDGITKKCVAERLLGVKMSFCGGWLVDRYPERTTVESSVYMCLLLDKIRLTIRDELKTVLILGGGFNYCFHPDFAEDYLVEEYFSDWLKPPTRI